MTRVLWIVQLLLALLFLFAGIAKLVMPLEPIVAQTGLPGALLRFVAVCECLGGLGMVLPGLLRIRPGLTPLAAAGLVIIMVGATVLTINSQGLLTALFPLVTGALAAFVAYGRWRVAPLRGRTAPGEP